MTPDAPALLALIDDDATFVRAMLRELGDMGFRVRGFTRPEAALRFLCEDQDERADAVITDFAMPGLTGSELCSAVREIAGDGAPPFILLTGSGESLEPSERALFDLVLAKPCTGQHLLAAIAEVSRRRESRSDRVAS
ncbi:MAG: response regulator [Myxococcota bacterium]|nr:response regulator [Myxococcota bacterium]